MVFLFDGDCAFCTTSANLLKRLIRDKANVIPYQFADLAALSVSKQECERAVQYLRGEEVFSGSIAIAKVLVDAKNLWSVAGWLMQLPVVSSAGFLVYEWVAKNRHKLPGGTPACAIPTDR